MQGIVGQYCNVFCRAALWWQNLFFAVTAYGCSMHIVLFEPEIPPNTGNVARLCAAADTDLHLIEPLGFKLENRYLKRAGLDYWPNVRLHLHADWQAFVAAVLATGACRAIMTTAKDAPDCRALPDFAFQPDDCLIFGPETRGLPADILAQSPHHVRIPMLEGAVRSINLSTAAGIVLYTALFQCGMTEAWE